jgi:uncharacterized membrane protein YgcG
MKKLLILFVFIVSLFAEEIDKYDVYLNVSQNGKLNVSEVITYNFGEVKKHGIFRFIPILRGKPENISVSMDNHTAKLVTATKDNKLIIRIGDAHKLVTGVHTYKIKYTMDKVVREYNDNLNTIRFNAIGTEWEIPIKVAKIYLKLPAILQNATIKTFSGVYGSTTTTAKVKKLDELNYLITMKNLPPKNGLTVGIYFDKNLIKAYKKPQPNNLWVWFFVIVFSMGSYIFYKQHIVHLGPIAPQYYPPKNFDILQSGVLIDEEFNDKDVTAAILELATKGYLKIKKEDKQIILEKTESDKELSPFLKDLNDILFVKEDYFILGEEDLILAKVMRHNISTLKDKLFNWAIKNGYFSKTPKSAKSRFFMINLLVALPFIIFAGYQTLSIADENVIGVSVFLIFDMVFILIALFLIKAKVMKILFMIVPVIQLVGLSTEILETLKYPFPLILLVLIPIIYFSSKVDVYTAKGAKILQYLLGFKDFIQKVEANKIKLFLEKDAEYLDKVLPYAVLFGISEHWLKLYSELNKEIEWYEGDTSDFDGLYDDLYDSFETTKNYTQSESSSSSFTGSDSSGGGSGGGGGGSW